MAGNAKKLPDGELGDVDPQAVHVKKEAEVGEFLKKSLFG